MSDLIIDGSNGHRSASQRREKALKVEIMRMKILSDHLRAVVILILRKHCDATITLSKQEILETLGHPLDSTLDEDGNIVFIAEEFTSCLSIDCPRKAEPHGVGSPGCSTQKETP